MVEFSTILFLANDFSTEETLIQAKKKGHQMHIHEKNQPLYTFLFILVNLFLERILAGDTKKHRIALSFPTFIHLLLSVFVEPSAFFWAPI